MKHLSESFNKRSRLVLVPELKGERRNRLSPPDGATLKERLVAALRVQQDFFPCFDWVFPPPVFPKAKGPAGAEKLFTDASVVPGTYSIYVHIPFCQTLCSFCYYPVLPGRGSQDKSAYVDHLLREMAMYRESLVGLRCESVYVGGGTPTSLDDEQLIQMFEGIRRQFDLDDAAEITVESAPGTLSRDKVALLKSLGTNRLSYGIQSLDEKLLASMNRSYAIADAIEELEQALPLIGNINVDTMYGFENEPADALLKTIATFERVGVPGLTIYSLDPQRSVRKSIWLGPSRDRLFHEKIDIYRKATELLASFGYRRLFQNTFAKAGLGSYRHQLRRWENVSLIALGIGAMGYAPRRTYQNYGTRDAYFQHLDAGRLPIEAVEELSPEMELGRQVTTQLRFAKVNLRAVYQKYGVDIEVVFRDLLRVLGELAFLERRERDGEIFLSDAAAPYNNVLPMLFSPDSFKEDLLGLPEEYVAAMPIPFVLTRVGATQSAPFGMTSVASTPADGHLSTGEAFYPDGSCPVVANHSHRPR
jgi:oxygen-independent coproporphyrinogen-3 oxidase